MESAGEIDAATANDNLTLDLKDPTAGSETTETIVTTDSSTEHDDESEGDTFSDGDNASGHTDSNQGTDSIDEGDSDTSSETDKLTVATIDPTTGDTSDGKVTFTDNATSKDSLDDQGRSTTPTLSAASPRTTQPMKR